MSILFDTIKTLSNKDITKASINLMNNRYNTCLKCIFFNKKTKSCGTLFKGGNLKYKGENKKLCGCYLPDKVKYLLEECPLLKW